MSNSRMLNVKSKKIHHYVKQTQTSNKDLNFDGCINVISVMICLTLVCIASSFWKKVSIAKCDRQVYKAAKVKSFISSWTKHHILNALMKRSKTVN